MASITMTASSFLSGTTAPTTPRNPTTTARGGGVVAKVTQVPEQSYCYTKEETKTSSKRRDLVFAVAAIAACSAAKIAMADEEPKKGTPEAKKKYAPICVTMPTASVCHK